MKRKEQTTKQYCWRHDHKWTGVKKTDQRQTTKPYWKTVASEIRSTGVMDTKATHQRDVERIHQR